MKLTSREKTLLVIVAIIGLGVLYYMYVYTPLNEEIALKEQELQDIEMELATVRGQVDTIPKLKTKLKKEEEKFETLSEDFLDGWDEPVILNYLEEVIKELEKEGGSQEEAKGDIIRYDIKFAKNEPQPHYASGLVNYELLISYSDLRTLIGKLEKAPYFNMASGIEIEDEGKTAFSGKLDSRARDAEEEDDEEDDDNTRRAKPAVGKEELRTKLDLVFFTLNDVEVLGSDYKFMTKRYKKDNIFVPN